MHHNAKHPHEKYRRMNITLPPDIAEWLDKQGNKSEVIAEALRLKRTLKESVFKHKESELVVQALKALGQERIDEEVLQKLAGTWTPSIWKKILRDTKTAPAWVSDMILNISKRSDS